MHKHNWVFEFTDLPVNRHCKVDIFRCEDCTTEAGTVVTAGKRLATSNKIVFPDKPGFVLDPIFEMVGLV